MVGDMLIHTSVWKSGARPDGTYNYDHFFANLADEFSGADISMVNQETILGGTEHGLEDFPYFNSPQELGDAEVKAGVDVAVSATNHALDHGFDGICWTLDYWHGTHPEVVVPGIAATEEEALEPKVVERNGIKVAIVSYTEITNLLSPPADKRWCLNILRDADIAADVARAREAGADIVVACPHWGTEYVYRPDDAQPRWASDFVDAGVDAIPMSCSRSSCWRVPTAAACRCSGPSGTSCRARSRSRGWSAAWRSSPSKRAPRARA